MGVESAHKICLNINFRKKAGKEQFYREGKYLVDRGKGEENFTAIGGKTRNEGQLCYSASG